MESQSGGKSGLVLAGGGARAAYQVGVLKALRDLLPEPKVNPFAIICGTSAVAINAGSLAVYADDFSHAVDNLFEVWRHFQPHNVYRSDFVGVVANSFRWLAGFLFGAFLKNRRISLLDNRPLESLLSRRLDFSRIEHNIKAGALDAVAITCSGYTSGQSCSFFEASDQFEGWQRSQVAAHVMNSLFLDRLAADLERVERINRTISCVDPPTLRKMGLSLHHVDVLVLTPSEPLEGIAVKHVGNLPWTIRSLLRSVG